MVNSRLQLIIHVPTICRNNTVLNRRNTRSRGDYRLPTVLNNNNRQQQGSSTTMQGNVGFEPPPALNWGQLLLLDLIFTGRVFFHLTPAVAKDFLLVIGRNIDSQPRWAVNINFERLASIMLGLQLHILDKLVLAVGSQVAIRPLLNRGSALKLELVFWAQTIQAIRDLTSTVYLRFMVDFGRAVHMFATVAMVAQFFSQLFDFFIYNLLSQQLKIPPKIFRNLSSQRITHLKSYSYVFITEKFIIIRVKLLIGHYSFFVCLTIEKIQDAPLRNIYGFSRKAEDMGENQFR